MEAVIERVWRCTSMPQSSEFGDAIGGHDRATLKMHFEAAIERVGSCTWRLLSSKFGDALGGYDRG